MKAIETSTNPLIQLQPYLKEIADEFGFVGALYLMHLAPQDNTAEGFGSVSVSLSRRQTMSNFLYSDSRMEMMRKEYIEKAIRFDPNIKGKPAGDFQIFSYEGDDKGCKICRDVLTKYGVRTRLGSLFTSEEHPDYIGSFLFMSDLSPEQLEQHRVEIWPHIQPKLKNFNEILMCTKAATILNPLINFGLVTEKGKRIVELIAAGNSRTEIAQIMYLTERGVDYHLNRMKRLFDSKNNAQLVSAAYKYKVIS